MPKALNIKKTDPNIPSWWLFKELREKGIEYISSFSGELWTDHNLHDPGISILEVLCYAISDLGYRTNLDIKELLALPNGEQEDNFFTPEQILTCNPLTVLDYRKMLVDISGVRNAWMLPSDEQEVPLYINCEKERLQFSSVKNEDPNINELVLNGLYKVFLDIDPVLINSAKNACEDKSSPIDTILRNVKKRLHQHRNLCEDFFDIIVLQDELIGVCADIELEPNANPDEVLEAIFEAIENELSPRLNFFSLKEMIENNKSIEEIFEGRPYTPAYGDANKKYSHGFVDTKELKNSKFSERLLASDYYRVIMEVDGVRAIKSLLLGISKDGESINTEEEWTLDLTRNHRPVFVPELSNFNFTKGAIRIPANTQGATNRFKKRLQDFRKNKFNQSELDLDIPYGNFREDLEDYSSIQHEFPLVYGIGKGHLSSEAPELRKAQALQLKAYLTFYDQMLAGYLSQLSNIRQMFSWNAATIDQGQTYFQQAINEDIPLAEKIFLSLYQSGQLDEWSDGDVLALPPKPFSHPTERDMAIIQLVGLFNNFSTNDKENIIEIKEESDGVFCFVVNGNNETPVLKSKLTYESEAEALRASDILFFYGTLAQSYEHLNLPEYPQYSFSLVFKTIDYTDYLKSITESGEKYYSRKDSFLNHLLARFGEQFTEYVLLMYALNQGVPDPKKIIQDKTRFLSKYPEISRNRGRGFDYTRRHHIWNSKENISGFEERVSGLMGLENWERRYLNNFEVVLREQKYLLTVKDHRDTVLFETIDGFEPDAIGKAANDFARFLSDSNAYETFDCINQNIFGFRLCDQEGKLFANYHRTFGSEALRDEMLLCTQNYFSQYPFFAGKPFIPDPSDTSDTSNFTGLVVNIVAEDEGFYFLLQSDDGLEIYMKSSQAYETEKEACYAWVEFVKRAKTQANFKVDVGNYDGGKYSFVIYTDENQEEELAFHPTGYSLFTTRDDKKTAVANFVFNKKLEYEISRSLDSYSWYLSDEDDNVLLESHHKFKLKDQISSDTYTTDAWREFKTLAVDNNNYACEPAEDGFRFSIVKKTLLQETNLEEKGEDNDDNIEVITVAQSIIYATETERDVAKQNFQKKIQQEESSGIGTLIPQITTHEGLYYFTVKDNDDQILFISSQGFETEPEAACSYFHFVEEASDPDNYSEIIQKGTCLHSFKVVERKKSEENPDEFTQTELGYHPFYYLEPEKNTKQESVITFIQNNKIPFEIKKLPGSFHYEIGWENCKGKCEPLLVEDNGNHGNIKEAREAAINLLEEYNEDKWEKVENEKDYSFALKDKESFIRAKHPEWFSSEQQRDKVLEDAKRYLKHYLGLSNGNIITPTAKWEVCSEPCEEDKNAESCLLSGFQLNKKDSPLAFHPTTFYKPGNRDGKFSDLVSYDYHSQLYSDLYLQGSRITTKIKDKYYFELWLKEPTELLWRSTASYNSKAEAQAAFDKNWFSIIELARDKKNYKLPVKDGDTSSYVSLCDKDNPISPHCREDECIVYFPEKLGSEAQAKAKIENLRKIAIKYPVYTLNGEYRFRLFNKYGTDVLWESSLAYTTFVEALKVFHFFFQLLKKPANYRRINNNKACVYKIEIGETLLESNRTYANTLSNEHARLDQPFDKYEEADAALGSILELIAGLKDNLLSITFKHGVKKSRREYFFSFKVVKNGNESPSWDSGTGYATSEEAENRSKDFQKFFEMGSNFEIEEYEEEDEILFRIIIKNKIGACPAIFPNKEITVGTNLVQSSEDCEIFKNTNCIKTICPSAWDEGLQSFLIYAIREANYYPFVDYKHNCQWSFRIVTDKYRIARNLDEFHTPLQQATYKDWLYGISRCEKPANKDLPKQKILKKKGQYHYYVVGDDGELLWQSFQGYDEKKQAIDAFNEQLFDFYASAQEIDFYQLGRETSKGAGRRLQLLNADSGVIAQSCQRYLKAEEWNAAARKRILMAREFPYFSYKGKYGFQCFSFEDAPKPKQKEKSDCVPLIIQPPENQTGTNGSREVNPEIPGEVVWESIQEYDSIEEAQCAFEEFLVLVKDKQNYQATKLEDCNLFGLEITHPGEVLATHPQRYDSKTNLNAAIERTRACINAEGFHLIEHILLRPKQGISNHITIQFWDYDEMDCLAKKKKRFPRHLLEDVFTNESEAQDAKASLIKGLESLKFDPLTSENVISKLKGVVKSKKWKLVQKNLDSFTRALFKKIEAVGWENTLQSFLFCFNKTSGVTPDKLIPICPDCDNVEFLPEEQATAAACTDSKELLTGSGNSNNSNSAPEGTYYVPGSDPYSFWTTIILPYWPERFQNANFRNFFEDTLRRETPAHLGLRICWLDPKQMRSFERAYRDWLEAFSGNKNCNLQDAQHRLVTILFDEEEGITNVYPPAQLQGQACAPEGDSPNAVLLDFTQLG